MKVRNGFVSNSSSSSFIVIFDCDPRGNPDYLKKILYGDRDEIVPQYADLYADFKTVSTDVLVSHILSELEGKEPVGLKEVIDAIRFDMIDYYDNPLYGRNAPEYGTEEYELLQEKMDRESIQKAITAAEEFLKKSKGKQVFILEFEDGCQIGAQLEHGGTFDGLENIRISHH